MVEADDFDGRRVLAPRSRTPADYARVLVHNSRIRTSPVLVAEDSGDVLLDVITQLLPWVGYPRTLNALTYLNEIAPGRL